MTTEGFRDVLELRRLRTPHMYDWRWRKPATLVERRLRFELPERVQADGQVLAAPAHGDMEALVDRLMAERVEAIAICFLHSYRYPDHERLVGAFLAARLPGVAVSLSSDIMREQGEYERTATTVVNAYVRPLMAGYLSRIRTGLEASGISAPLMIMQSSGGVMTDADAGLRPVLALESGPAAGAIATARDRAAHGLRGRDRVRHGRDDREGFADRRRTGVPRPRVRGGRRHVRGQPAHPRQR